MGDHADIDHSGLTGVPSANPQFTTIELGHASDTTIARASAGNLTVEGNALYRAGGTDVPIADGGTGASTASGARSNLGLASGINNYAASAAPAVTDDNGDGYSVGSVWIDTTGDDAYICVDASTGAAVWLPFDSASGESWEGTWSAGTYTLGQIVEHDDVIYQVNAASTTDEPPGTDWDVLYTAPSGGGPMLQVDAIALDAAGDEFDVDMSGWTTGGSPSVGSVITTETYDDTCLELTFPSQADRYYKSIDSGDWTYYLTIYGVTNSTPSPQTALNAMLALCATDNSGTGTGVSLYNDSNGYMWGVASHAYTSTGNQVVASFNGLHPPAASNWPIVYRLAKSGTTITGGISFDGGANYLTHTRSDSTTFTRIGIYRLFSSGGTNPKLRVGRFNLVP